jgi:hypothetical protein
MDEPVRPDNETVLLDDGVFYIQTSAAAQPARAAGFLHRRCYYGVTSPGGFECIGSFTTDSEGRWQARIDAPYDSLADDDTRPVGLYVDRFDAIVCLWRHRAMALCRHFDDAMPQAAEFVGKKLLFKMLSPAQQLEARVRFVDAGVRDACVYELAEDNAVLCRRRVPELVEALAYVPR